jgi:hypothetical protein
MHSLAEYFIFYWFTYLGISLMDIVNDDTQYFLSLCEAEMKLISI